MIDPNILDILQSIDIAIIEYFPDNSLQIIGKPPIWFDEFFKDITNILLEKESNDTSVFLQHFMVDAIDFWDKSINDKIKSGIWIESNCEGQEKAFEATAVYLNQKKFLVIETAYISYEEKQNIIQKGRELSLAYQALAHTEIELRKAKDAAEKANMAKSNFIAVISHEIRNPLSNIIAMLDILLYEDDNSKEYDDKYRNTISIIKNSADSILRIANDILDLSKIESHKLEFFMEDFNIRNLLKDIINAYSYQTKNKGIKIESNISNDIPEYLNGDQSRLRQIITNLLSNAIKFTEKGSISLNIKKEFEDETSFVILFSVKDTGIGIQKDKVSQLFQNYNQLDASYSKKYGGTGLGLSISKKLVEMMDGSIGVETEESKGSTFYFTIKLKKSLIYSKININQPKNDILISEDIQEETKILIAEDNIVNQKILSHILGKAGYDSVVVSDGIEVLEVLQKENFDLIIMDIQMPKMNGIETAKIIRKNNISIPIIALSGTIIEKTQFNDFGIDKYLTKPINKNELFETINNLVK
ncbi:MAG: hypothetical protein A2086_12765 [Spirochaetes bacterium GWD1_27_9]|nr:MAG: hypothetical protein A2Z98_17970 [Spirochaetes bacterium GWB1_27_13]OHD24028.1 MAG: hypothetical protein A2Y34_14000 [Spirochaetes bacterium GWC1_27_15]OHD43950.1 MAG: hypothetical protein A2086_12765 [Spirochaetes bacterium GWD1_27_9]